MRTALCLTLLFTLSAFAGTETKAKPSDYPTSVEAPGGIWLAADFGGHTFSAENTSFLVEDYICIEVAIFPKSGAEIMVAASQFALKLNNKKPLQAQTPGMVAASMKYPDWTQRPTMEGQAGPIAVGPRPQSRFPGDPNDRTNRLPGPAGSDPTAGTADRKAPTNPAELIPKVALDEGKAHAARSGYLFFPYGGKLAKLKTMELIYSGGPDGMTPVVLKLR